jgi:lactobin A/cerein 7B family class IIb bacteriocin
MALPVSCLTNPLMVSRLKLERIKMNMPIEMNMPIAAAMDSELRVLTDNELDDVNGGFFFLAYIAAAAVGAAVGSAIGYAIGKGINCIRYH